MEFRPRAGDAARFVLGMLLGGYGGLVLLDLLAHESKLVGVLLLAAGTGLLVLPRQRAYSQPRHADVGPGLRWTIAGAGAVAACGTLVYNGIARSTLSLPECVILAYGLALVVASGHLDRVVGRARVADLVAWSIPLLAAPLVIYAVDAAIDARSDVGQSPLDGLIRHALVYPMSGVLSLLGFSADAQGQTIGVATPRGNLFLSVGLVCAGIEPGILFLGVFGLYAWHHEVRGWRLAIMLAVGLIGVYAANLVRLLILVMVGYWWGGAALRATHAHAGWLLFVGWIMAFWWVVLRRFHHSMGPPIRSGRAPLS